LGIIFAGPQNGGLPPLNLPSISVSGKSNGAATPGKTSAASATKKVEKKVVKAKKLRTATSGYDLELDEEVRTAEVKARGADKVASFDRVAAVKKDEEARAASRAKVEAAGAEKKAKKLKLAEEKAEKGVFQAKTQDERAAKQAEARVSMTHFLVQSVV
jgi:hypothetical protein